ncbi:MAG TPA: helix-turn-helix domain-containing protein [Clostridia bacterium]|jgi:hypothetical protein|nr:helix-turn-helix domain-containing protein [Clostridiaceae bacterium]HOM34030.1 helix-turn-helix domain-containing protein [Clostridia bacterium]
MTVSQITDAYYTTATTVQNVRTSYANNGLEATIRRKKRETPLVPLKVTGDVEAHIVSLACGSSSEGYECWTVHLLADKCVELDYVESLSHMTVARVLKKRI